jgi:hypothetical protein
MKELTQGTTDMVLILAFILWGKGGMMMIVVIALSMDTAKFFLCRPLTLE